MPTPTEKWLQQIANRQGTKKSALTMDSPSASLFPPLALTYIPCCYSPSSFALSCDLSSTTTSTEDTPPPFSLPSSPLLHLQHHHTCLRCRLQLPAPQLSTESISPPHLSQISIVLAFGVPYLKLLMFHLRAQHIYQSSRNQIFRKFMLDAWIFLQSYVWRCQLAVN